MTCSLARPLLALPPQHPYRKTIGLQLWTVRNQLEADLAGTLRSVADAGYYQVELMQCVGGEEVCAAARDAGLAVTSSFIDWNAICHPEREGVPSTSEIIDTAKKMGLQYLVFGYIGKGSRETADQLKEIADRTNRFGEECRAASIELCYHNHAFEFEPLADGKRGCEILMDRFDSDFVKLELDVFWAAIGGYDPVETLRRLKGRVAQVHLKDLKAGTGTIYDESQVPEDAFQELGDGRLDMGAIIAASRNAGVAQCHVEQDHSPDPLASIRQSLEYLRS